IAIHFGSVFRRHCGDLPEMEHAGIVELFDDLRADAMQLGQIVWCATRRSQKLETLLQLLAASGSFRLGQRFRGWLSHRANVDASSALAARNAIESSACNEVAVKRDGATGIVIGRNGIG